MEQLDRIEAKLDQLLGKPGWVDNVRYVGPGIVVIDEACINFAEPVRADWMVPMMSREFTRRGQIGSEPSNAPEGHPRRSPAGYPLFYPIRGNGIVGPARVIYGESTFANDSEVEAWKAAAAARDAVTATYR